MMTPELLTAYLAVLKQHDLEVVDIEEGAFKLHVSRAKTKTDMDVLQEDHNKFINEAKLKAVQHYKQQARMEWEKETGLAATD